ncbi:MAG: bifunctional hydroxymethylpyrimidine kinase/phosphomethylpyrimidine kinase [Halorientalis sp.]
MTRRVAPESRPVALTIAGSDSGGGAGVQADLKTMEACGAFGTSAITSVTAQNTRGVEGTHLLPVAEVERQIEAVLDDFAVRGVKTGMLATAEIVDAVAAAADRLPNLVVDPVMVAASGDRLLEPEAEAAYEDLIDGATLVTPNADEAGVLTGIDPETESDMRAVGEELLDFGASAALVTGGHVGDGDEIVDVLVTEDGVGTFRHPRVGTDATHGSGCTLSSAVAAHLAKGDDLTAAVAAGVDLLSRAVRYPLDVGEGPGSVHHAVALRDRAARDPTAEAVSEVVERFVDRDVSPLVPEVGTNVAGATPYAERPDETAAVEGRITRTLSGVRPNRGVRFGASSHVARFLLACREFDPGRRFAVNCRFGDDVAAALAELDGEVVTVDHADTPDAATDRAGTTRSEERSQRRLAEAAFERADGSPVAVADEGGAGREPMVRLLADDAPTLADRTLAVLDALDRGTVPS